MSNQGQLAGQTTAVVMVIGLLTSSLSPDFLIIDFDQRRWRLTRNARPRKRAHYLERATPAWK